MKHSSRNLLLSARRPGGFILMIILVVLTLMTGLSVVWAQRVTLQHRQSNQRAFAVQAAWLADSALQRAMAQFAADSEYEGEIWQISAEDLDGSHRAKIEIKVIPGEQQDTRTMEVLVDYPEDPLLRQRVRRQQQLLLSQPESQPDRENP